MIEFFVPGPPQGKARARTFTTMTGRVRSCTPPKTAAYEAMIRSCYRVAAQGQPEPYYGPGTPVRIAVTAFYKIPVKTNKRTIVRMQHGLVRPMRKPDLDNILKAVCDALNGIAYKDDAQIVDIATSKFYSCEAEEGLRIEVAAATEDVIRG